MVKSFPAFLAAVVLGCIPQEDPDDPIGQAMRDAAAAEKGIVRRGRGPTWVLVKFRRAEEESSFAASASAPSGGDVQAAQVAKMKRGYSQEVLRFAVVDSVPEGPQVRTTEGADRPGPHGSILLRPGQRGFLALSRGEPVEEFTLAGKMYGGGDIKTDRGFDVVVRVPDDGSAAVQLTPVFRGLGEDGADLCLDDLAFEETLGPGQALVVGPSGRRGALEAAIFGAESRVGGRALRIQIETFR